MTQRKQSSCGSCLFNDLSVGTTDDSLRERSEKWTTFSDCGDVKPSTKYFIGFGFMTYSCVEELVKQLYMDYPRLVGMCWNYRAILREEAIKPGAHLTNKKFLLVLKI